MSEKNRSDVPRCVVIESPYAGDVERNTRYARACMLDSLRRHEAPLLSHLLYTQVLDDMLPEERRLGIEAGLAWLPNAEATIVYTDLGVSPGMEKGVERAQKHGIEVEFRKLGGGWLREP